MHTVVEWNICSEIIFKVVTCLCRIDTVALQNIYRGIVIEALICSSRIATVAVQNICNGDCDWSTDMFM